MFKLKNLTSLICAFAILFTLPASAAETKYADILYNLDLFLGTENGYELESTLTREQSAVMLVRLLGEEQHMRNYSYTTEFSDVPRDKWSYYYVAYCYENEITKGTGNNTFSPELDITAEEFITLVLRLLGYTEATPETALQEAVYKGLITSDKSREFSSAEEFLREDMVFITYRSLKTKTSTGKVLARVLADKNVLTNAEADEFDIFKNKENISDIINELME